MRARSTRDTRHGVPVRDDGTGAGRAAVVVHPALHCLSRGDPDARDGAAVGARRHRDPHHF